MNRPIFFAPTAQLQADTRSAVPDAEIEQHAKDCGLQVEWAMARADRGDPHARDEALMWWAQQRDAIAVRDTRSGAARHAAFEAAERKKMDEGAGFFCSDYAMAMGRPGWKHGDPVEVQR